MRPPGECCGKVDLDAEAPSVDGSQRSRTPHDLFSNPGGERKVERNLDGFFEGDRARRLLRLGGGTGQLVDGDQALAHEKIISTKRVE